MKIHKEYILFAFSIYRDTPSFSFSVFSPGIVRVLAWMQYLAQSVRELMSGRRLLKNPNFAWAHNFREQSKPDVSLGFIFVMIYLYLFLKTFNSILESSIIFLTFIFRIAFLFHHFHYWVEHLFFLLSSCSSPLFSLALLGRCAEVHLCFLTCRDAFEGFLYWVLKIPSMPIRTVSRLYLSRGAFSVSVSSRL